MRQLDGRRIWFVGIGGAGLSAYAMLAKAWGADVAGWDKRETPFLARVRAGGIAVTIGPEPVVDEAAELVVSTAYARQVQGRSRAEFLAELVARAPAIVVAGAHGKTTTAAMIAFCLDRLGYDPSFAIGGEVAQLGTHARAGTGPFVVEGDESDRTVAALPARVAVITNVDLDHHTTFASRAEVEELFEAWVTSMRVPVVVRGESLDPVEFGLRIPGEHNRLNAACALAALEAVGVSREVAIPLLADFAGAGRRLEARGEAAGIRVFDDYGHHPAEVAATLAAARELAGDGRLVVLFQPHLYSRTLYLAYELASALAAADVVCVADVYPAREAPLDGVTGKLVVDRLCELRPGMRIAWAPRVAEAAALVAREARAGDVVVTIGAGDVDAAVPAILAGLSA